MTQILQTIPLRIEQEPENALTSFERWLNTQFYAAHQLPRESAFSDALDILEDAPAADADDVYAEIEGIKSPELHGRAYNDCVDEILAYMREH